MEDLIESGKSTENQDLIGFVDADWEVETRKFTSWYVLKFGGSISWASVKQSNVSLSSPKAEYVALVRFVKSWNDLRIVT